MVSKYILQQELNRFLRFYITFKHIQELMEVFLKKLKGEIMMRKKSKLLLVWDGIDTSVPGDHHLSQPYYTKW